MTLGEKRAGVGGTSCVDPKLREKLWEKFWMGLSVISDSLGDIRSPQAVISWCGRSSLRDNPENPKSKPSCLEADGSLLFKDGSTLSSALANALSLADVLGVELPRAREGVPGKSSASADNVGLCFTTGFLIVLVFSAFF